MKSETSNIIIADTQFLITESLKILIRDSTAYSLLGTADDLIELKNLLAINQTNSDILLITDYVLFDYEVLKQIKNEYPKLQVLILTNSINRNELNELTRSGIKNIIYKTTGKKDLFLSVEAAFKGEKYYCQEVLDILMDTPDKNGFNEPCHLTPTEIEIIKHIANGLTTKEIAVKRNVSFHTIMSHRKNIFFKLNINNVSELVIYAVRAGFVTDIEYYI